MDLFKRFTDNGDQPDTRYTTRCRCGWYLKTPPMVKMADGSFDPALIELIAKLKHHVESKHPDVGGQIGVFSAFLIAAAFKLEDPLLIQMHRDLRRALHFQTRPATVTDEQIEERVSRLEELSPSQQEAVAFLLRDMRDVLTEQGNYAPKPADSPLVTA